LTTLNRLADYPYLKNAFISYLLLGTTDIVHHWHAAIALGDESAMHAVAIGVILLPISLAMIWLFNRQHKKIYVWIIIVICAVTALIPGILHGGRYHLLKILGFPTAQDELANDVSPFKNVHIWFYEISGVLEFFLGIVCAYFLYKFILDKTKSNSLPS